jgi:uncharacterized protein (TIGR00369 family)
MSDTQAAPLSRAQILKLSGLEQLQSMIEGKSPAPPIAAPLSFRLTEASAGLAVFVGEPKAEFLNPLGSVHGGWVSTLLDSAMACAVHSLLKPGQIYTTVEMKVNFVRPVLPTSGPLRCEGSIIHFGSRIATSQGHLTDAKGKLYAHGTETCLVMDTSPI